MLIRYVTFVWFAHSTRMERFETKFPSPKAIFVFVKLKYKSLVWFGFGFGFDGANENREQITQWSIIDVLEFLSHVDLRV